MLGLLLFHSVQGARVLADSTELCALNSQFVAFLKKHKVPIEGCNISTASRLPLGVLAENTIESTAEYCANYGEIIHSKNDLDLLNFIRTEASLTGVRDAGGSAQSLTQACARAVATNPTLTDLGRYPNELANALANSICFVKDDNSMRQLILNNETSQPMLGLRRWLFHPLLKTVSIGRDMGAYCARVVDLPHNYDTSNQLVVFPPPGPFPLALSKGDWTFSYIGSLNNVSVTIVNDMGEKVDIDVDKKFVAPGMLGMPTITIRRKVVDSYARSYFVLISLPDRVFTYRVRVIDCGDEKSGIATAIVAGAMFTLLVVVAMMTVKKQNEKEKILSTASPFQFS